MEGMIEVDDVGESGEEEGVEEVAGGEVGA